MKKSRQNQEIVYRRLISPPWISVMKKPLILIWRIKVCEPCNVVKMHDYQYSLRWRFNMKKINLFIFNILIFLWTLNEIFTKFYTLLFCSWHFLVSLTTLCFTHTHGDGCDLITCIGYYLAKKFLANNCNCQIYLNMEWAIPT